MNPIISVEHLSKRYRLGQIGATTLRESVERFVHRLQRRTKPQLSVNGNALLANTPYNQQPITDNNTASDELWALKDVSFEVNQGEVLGIIGRNGAGKSTLLKILSRITEPTSGRAVIRGRVASLLEVGTGFHPELSGRENIFLNGAILGMKKDEIVSKFDEIVAFSEVERFIDTPVKRYSSGMYVRLAFAVAAHLEPEILIVDEVLAVGDAGFQKKCIGKMGEVAREGRTVLFVSHNMVAVNSLCERAIWLDKGQLAEEGGASAIVSSYLRRGAGSTTEQKWDDLQTAPGTDAVRLKKVRVYAADDESSGCDITMQTPVEIEIEYWNLKPNSKLHITCHFLNDQGIVIFTSGSSVEPGWRLRPLAAGLYRCICHVPGDFLNSGVHSVNVLVIENCARAIFQQEAAAVFEVHDRRERESGWMGREPGAVRPRLDWTNRQLS